MKEEFTKKATEINTYLIANKATISCAKLEELIRHMKAFNYNCGIVKEGLAIANGPIQGLIYDKSFKEAELRLFQDLITHPGKRRTERKEVLNLLSTLKDQAVKDIELEKKKMTEFNSQQGMRLSLLIIPLEFPIC